MDYEKIFNYINKLNTTDLKEKEYYDEIVNFENEHFIPAVRTDVAFFLNLITLILKPKKILEIGFGSGVSSIFIGKDLSNIDKFISLEKDENRYNRGKRLLEKFNISFIDLQLKDSFDFFKENNEKFDLIFLDAEKTKYHEYIYYIKNNLPAGGILITDNIIFSGRVVEDNVEKKYVKGTNSIREFNEMISKDNDFKTLFFDTGDGISISMKR